MKTTDYPLIMHRWFQNGANWTYHPTMSGKVISASKAMKTELQERNEGEFQHRWVEQWLVGIRLRDPVCRDQNAIGREPYIVVAAVLSNTPTKEECMEIRKALWQREADFPQTSGALDGFVCQVQRQQNAIRTYFLKFGFDRLITRWRQFLSMFNRRVESDSHDNVSVAVESPRIAINDVVIVLFSDDITFGHWQNSKTDIPIEGEIEQRHAVLTRNHGSYRISALWSKDRRPHELYICRAGSQQSQKLNEAACFLEDGDVFTLGRNCSWLFRQPPNCSTAVLECMENVISDVRLRDNRTFRKLILMDKEFTVGASSEDHLQASWLPKNSQIRVTFEQRCLTFWGSSASLSLASNRILNDENSCSIVVEPIISRNNFHEFISLENQAKHTIDRLVLTTT